MPVHVAFVRNVARTDRQPYAPGGYLERVAGEPATTRAIGTIERIVSRLT